MAEKIAIVCGAPGSEMLAPFDDASYDIWVLGNRCDRYPRYDAIFEIHDDLSQHDSRYATFLLDQRVKLIVGEKYPHRAPWVEVYPYAEVHDMVGQTYLTSSSAYMLAYAVLESVKHVEIYGVDMDTDDHEYFWQRPCMEFWVGFAKGMGVNVEIAEQSPLCKSDYVEGRHFGDWQPKTPKPVSEYQAMADKHQAKRDAMIGQLNELSEMEQKIAALKSQVAAHDGAAQVYEALARLERGKTGTLTNSVAIA